MNLPEEPLIDPKYVKFCELLAENYNTKSAGKLCGWSATYAYKLIRDPQITEYVNFLRILKNENILETKKVIREYLEGLLTTPVSEIDENSLYAQEVTVIDMGEKGTKTIVKAVPKIKGLELLGKLEGVDIFASTKSDVTLGADPVVAEFVDRLRASKGE